MSWFLLIQGWDRFRDYVLLLCINCQLSIWPAILTTVCSSTLYSTYNSALLYVLYNVQALSGKCISSMSHMALPEYFSWCYPYFLSWRYLTISPGVIVFWLPLFIVLEDVSVTTWLPHWSDYLHYVSWQSFHVGSWLVLLVFIDYLSCCYIPSFLGATWFPSQLLPEYPLMLPAFLFCCGLTLSSDASRLPLLELLDPLLVLPKPLPWWYSTHSPDAASATRLSLLMLDQPPAPVSPFLILSNSRYKWYLTLAPDIWLHILVPPEVTISTFPSLTWPLLWCCWLHRLILSDFLSVSFLIISPTSTSIWRSLPVLPNYLTWQHYFSWCYLTFTPPSPDATWRATWLPLLCGATWILLLGCYCRLLSVSWDIQSLPAITHLHIPLYCTYKQYVYTYVFNLTHYSPTFPCFLYSFTISFFPFIIYYFLLFFVLPLYIHSIPFFYSHFLFSFLVPQFLPFLNSPIISPLLSSPIISSFPIFSRHFFLSFTLPLFPHPFC